MKKISMAVGAAIALAGVTAPAQAQLTVNGLGACFGSNSANTSVSSCNDNSSSTTWSMPGTPTSGDSKFMFDRSGSLDGAGGNSVTLGFGANNKSSILYMGWFRFDEGNDGTADATSKLNFNVYINNAATLSYNSLTVNYDLRNGDPERFSFTGGGYSNSWFSVTGDLNYEYRFAVVGFDYPHPGSNYCATYDAVPTVANKYYYDDPSGGKLCGEFERRALGQPSTNTVVPEPSTYALMGAGLLGIFGFARRRNRNA